MYMYVHPLTTNWLARKNFKKQKTIPKRKQQQQQQQQQQQPPNLGNSQSSTVTPAGRLYISDIDEIITTRSDFVTLPVV